MPKRGGFLNNVRNKRNLIIAILVVLLLVGVILYLRRENFVVACKKRKNKYKWRNKSLTTQYGFTVMRWTEGRCGGGVCGDRPATEKHTFKSSKGCEDYRNWTRENNKKDRSELGGKYFDITTNSVRECPKDTYSNGLSEWHGNINCLDCGPNGYTEGTGSKECIEGPQQPKSETEMEEQVELLRSGIIKNIKDGTNLSAVMGSKLDYWKFPLQVIRNAVNKQGPDGEWAPLHWAAAYNNTDAASELGDIRNDYGKYNPVGDGDHRYVNATDHSRPLDKDIQTNDGYTPLHYAVMTNSVDMVQWLLGCMGKRSDNWWPCVKCDPGASMCDPYFTDANSDIQDINGKTPLHWAAQAGYKNIVEILVTNGADITKTNNNKKTALDLAIEADHTDVKDYLLKVTREAAGAAGAARRAAAAMRAKERQAAGRRRAASRVARQAAARRR